MSGSPKSWFRDDYWIVLSWKKRLDWDIDLIESFYAFPHGLTVGAIPGLVTENVESYLHGSLRNPGLTPGLHVSVPLRAWIALLCI